MLLNKKNYKKLNKVTFTPKGKKKKKLEPGGVLDFLGQNSTGIGAAGNLAGGLLNSVAGDTYAGGIGAGALKGAGSLAALGPIGMGVGAVLGGVTGGLAVKKQKQELNSLNQKKSAAVNSWGVQNAGNALAKGGRLTPVSKDAVEVRANDPSKTDSVKIPQAFVDHNEIIDNKDRVFSDDLIAPSGRSIAKEAKRLEKMKDKRGRFADANKHIDSKLDQLFEFQESSKLEDTSMNKGAFRKGGKLKLAKGGDPITDLKIWSEGPVNDSLQAMYGKQPMLNPLQLNTQTSTSAGTVAGSGPMISPIAGSNQSYDWNKGLTNLATFA